MRPIDSPDIDGLTRCRSRARHVRTFKYRATYKEDSWCQSSNDFYIPEDYWTFMYPGKPC